MYAQDTEIELLDEIDNSTVVCVLRGKWTQVSIKPGDYLHIIGSIRPIKCDVAVHSCLLCFET
jgi:hypothetical protein